MRVLRGALADIERDREVTRRLTALVEERKEAILRVWTPPQQVAFGRRDAAEDGYERARKAAREHGYEPIERSVGGRAVAYTGQTIAFAYGVATDGERDGIERRYRTAETRLKRAFEAVDATVRGGEPKGAFCPGDHSLQHDGKLAGLAQRVRRESALVGGCVVACKRDERAVAAVLGAVYEALGVGLDPKAIGSVEGAGGPESVEAIREAIEAAFLDGRERTVLPASELLDS